VSKVASRGKEEEELRQLSVEMRFLEQAAETLQERLSMLNAAITDLSFANMTLDGVEKEKEGSEVLSPIGGGSYVKMKLASSDKVVVGIGAGVSVEKPLAEAKTMLKERFDEFQKSSIAAQQQFSQIAERISVGRNRLETLLSSVREEKAAGNV
jgi:prefoldin alpha subunit